MMKLIHGRRRASNRCAASPNAGVAYIVGAGHSGSSLLDLLLGAHPEVASGGEFHRLSLEPSTRACSCGNAVDECPWWREVLQQLDLKGECESARDWTEVGTTMKHRYRAGPVGLSKLGIAALTHGSVRLKDAYVRDQLSAAEASWSVVSAAAQVAGAQWMVDSSKTPGRLLALRAAAPSRRIRVIELVRDGRAVCASHMRREGIGMEVAAKRWRRDVCKSLVAAKLFGGSQRLRVRYEDLCTSPAATVESVWAFLEIPRSSFSIPAPGSYHLIPGNPMLLRPVTEVRADDSWPKFLTTRDRATFSVIAGPLNRLLGYE